jgi:chromosome segregation ATPase
MAETAGAAQADDKSAADRRPIYWALAIGLVLVSAAVSYKIVKSDGSVDVTGGVDGIQVKITQAQKTIESAQQEVSDAQRQLDAREASLKQQEQSLREREAKVQELLASIDKTTTAPRTLTPQQAQLELKKLRAAPPVAAGAPEPVAVAARIEKLDQLKGALGKTSIELKAAVKPPEGP